MVGECGATVSGADSETDGVLLSDRVGDVVTETETEIMAEDDLTDENVGPVVKDCTDDGLVVVVLLAVAVAEALAVGVGVSD